MHIEVDPLPSDGGSVVGRVISKREASDPRSPRPEQGSPIISSVEPSQQRISPLFGSAAPRAGGGGTAASPGGGPTSGEDASSPRLSLHSRDPQINEPESTAPDGKNGSSVPKKKASKATKLRDTTKDSDAPGGPSNEPARSSGDPPATPLGGRLPAGSAGSDGRSAGSSEVPSIHLVWACSLCSYHNPGGFRACEMCGTVRISSVPLQVPEVGTEGIRTVSGTDFFRRVMDDLILKMFPQSAKNVAIWETRIFGFYRKYQRRYLWWCVVVVANTSVSRIL